MHLKYWCILYKDLTNLHIICINVWGLLGTLLRSQQCGLEDESMTHFVTCEAYGENSHFDNLQEMYNSNAVVSSEIAHKVKKSFID